MDRERVNMDNLDENLENIALDILNLAEKNQEDSLFLLSLLRSLEEIHRKIRTEMFEPSLPTTRNKLYQLVKDIEEKGGWPYIERMKLQVLIQNLTAELTSETASESDS